jgi:hypothetical protein
MSRDYHSAHLPPVEDVTPVQRWVGPPDSSVALVWDVIYGKLPPEYGRCDVLYADLPWRTGFRIFERRAGITDSRTYREFMAAVSRIVADANRPTILVTGKHALNYLPQPAQTFPVRMLGTGQAALAILYNLVVGKEWTVKPYGLTWRLARTYECVGDFCCGYGNVLRAFAHEGKPFVASDYNPACIGYIAEHASSWTVPDA